MIKTQLIQWFKQLTFYVAVSSANSASWRGMCQLSEPESLKAYKKY